MKKVSVLFWVIAVAVLAVLSIATLTSSVFAASVSRSMAPERVAPGEDVTVTLSATGVKSGELFTIEDKVPAGWNLVSWDVQGVEGGRNAVKYRLVEGTRHGFSFTASSSSPTVTLTLRVPASASVGSYAFDAVYFDSSGQGRSEGPLTVRTITCGDSICEGAETSDTCEQDCPRPSAPAPVDSQPEQTGETEEKSGLPVTTIVAGILLVVALVAAFFLYTKGKKNGGRSMGVSGKMPAAKK